MIESLRREKEPELVAVATAFEFAVLLSLQKCSLSSFFAIRHIAEAGRGVIAPG